jgi:hypothetical protein
MRGYRGGNKDDSASSLSSSTSTSSSKPSSSKQEKKNDTIEHYLNEPGNDNDDQSFFQIIAKIQSNRLDDQRCFLKPIGTNSTKNDSDTLRGSSRSLTSNSSSTSSSSTTNNQQSTLKPKENSKKTKNQISATVRSADSPMLKMTPQDDEFFNLIMKSQKNRLEDQRSRISIVPTTTTTTKKSSLDPSDVKLSLPTSSKGNINNKIKDNQRNLRSISISQGGGPIKQGGTVPPDDAFFSMIHKFQSRRLDEQRTSISTTNNNNNNK